MCWVFTIKQKKHRLTISPDSLFTKMQVLQYMIAIKCWKIMGKEKEKVPEHLVIAHMPDTPPSPLCWLALVSSLLSHVDEDQ